MIDAACMRRVMAAYLKAVDAGAGEVVAVNAGLRAFLEVYPETSPLEARRRVLGLIEAARAKAPEWYWRNLPAEPVLDRR